MIHPDTEVRFVSEHIGRGVFATAPIPRGTIIYVRDPLETRLAPSQFNALDAEHKQIAEKYSYIDAEGHMVMSWDHAKFMNHCCECNTIGTGYGFEIAIRDIQAGEELTSEYGVLNLQLEYEIGCGCVGCRSVLRRTDIDVHHPQWDQWIVAALKRVRDVPQPLWSIMDAATRAEVERYLAGGGSYRSVLTRKWHKPDQVAPFHWTF
jgi:hypothetical protein